MTERHSLQVNLGARWVTPVLIVIIAALLVPAIAVATTCIAVQSTLQEDYELADAIVLAQASSCAEGEPVSGWNCEGQRFNLDVIEIIKDAVPSRDYAGAYQGADPGIGCGGVYQLGGTYLIFLDGEGGYSASIERVSGDDMRAFLAEQRLNILRQYRDGMVDDLSGPWWFMDTGVSCNVSHALAGGGISISFAYGDTNVRVSGTPRRGPDGELVFDVQPIPPGTAAIPGLRTTTGPTYNFGDTVLSVNLGNVAELLPARLSIKVGNRSWSLQQRTITVGTAGWQQESHSFVVGGKPALEIINAMSSPSEIVITAVSAGNSGTDAFNIGSNDGTPTVTRFETRTTQFANTSKKLKACIDGTVRRGVSSAPP